MGITKKHNLIFVFTLFLLIMSVLLPITSAYFTDEDTISGGYINLPYVNTSVSFKNGTNSENANKSGQCYSFVATKEEYDLKVSISSNIPVFIKVVSFLSLGGDNCITSDDFEYFYNGIVNKNVTNTTTTEVTIGTISCAVGEEIEIEVEVVQANEFALNTMWQDKDSTILTTLNGYLS